MSHKIQFDPRYGPPTPEVLRKIILSGQEVEGMEKRDLNCPICGFRIEGMYQDRTGHAEVKCRKCKATMIHEHHGGYSSLVCPYCGNSRLLVESDAVKLAQLRTVSELTGMEYRYREHRDSLDLVYSRRRAQTIVICVFVAIIFVLICLYAFGVI